MIFFVFLLVVLCFGEYGRFIGVCEPENNGFIISSYEISKGMNMTSSDEVDPGYDQMFLGHVPMAIDYAGYVYFGMSTRSNLEGFGDQTIYTYRYRDDKDYFKPRQIHSCVYTNNEEYILLDLQYSKNLKMLFGVSFDKQNFTSIVSIDPKTCDSQMIYSGKKTGIHYPTDGSFGGLFENEEEGTSKYIFLHDVLKNDLSEYIVLDLKKQTINRDYRDDYDHFYSYLGGSISCVDKSEVCYMNTFKIPYYEQAKEEIYSIDMKNSEKLTFLKIDQTIQSQNPDRKTFFVTRDGFVGRVLTNIEDLDSFVMFKIWDSESTVFSETFDGLNSPYENYCYDPFFV